MKCPVCVAEIKRDYASHQESVHKEIIDRQRNYTYWFELKKHCEERHAHVDIDSIAFSIVFDILDRKLP